MNAVCLTRVVKKRMNSLAIIKLSQLQNFSLLQCVRHYILHNNYQRNLTLYHYNSLSINISNYQYESL